MILRILLFLVINFSALGIGGFFTSKGVPSNWYATLNKAPWTPPGWAFGFAWTTIMICFAIYIAYLWPIIENKKFFLILFIAQWILNVSWNPTFFYFHQTTLGLFIIIGLTIIVGYTFYHYLENLNFLSILIAPYFIWLLIATSLNAYAVLNN